MKKFRVLIPEVHYSHRIIEAETPEEARERAGEEGEEVYLEYSHTIEEKDPSEWECSEEPEEKANG